MKRIQPTPHFPPGQSRAKTNPWRLLGLARPVLQAVLLGTALTLSLLAELRPVHMGGLLALGTASFLAGVARGRSPHFQGKAAFYLASAGTVASLLGLVSSFEGPELFDAYIWIVAACAAGTAALNHRGGEGRRWLRLACVWLFTGTGLWLAGAYLRDEPGPFYGNWCVVLAGLSLLARVARMPDWARLAIHTLILLMVALPLTNLGIARVESENRSNRGASTPAAPVHPSTLSNEEWEKWWSQYMDQWAKFGEILCVPDPKGVLPFLLKPGGEMVFGNCPIKLNRFGFRDREFATDKDGAYRIVCLGESTTFGATLETNDVPWPRLLERAIQERLKPKRRVEVINAGVPGYHLLNNLELLRRDILPLKPDMIVSYHGFNGFKLLGAVLPSKAGVGVAPARKNRPIHLLANVEYRLRLWLHHRRKVIETMLPPAEVPLPLETPYAQAYRELIAICRARRIELLLCDYSMAMNKRNPTARSEFYRTAFPPSARLAQANSVHTLIVRELARLHPETHYVETHGNLDGDADKFLDLIHLRQPGRQQLAEHVFAGVSNVLFNAGLSGR